MTGTSNVIPAFIDYPIELTLILPMSTLRWFTLRIFPMIHTIMFRFSHHTNISNLMPVCNCNIRLFQYQYVRNWTPYSCSMSCPFHSLSSPFEYQCISKLQNNQLPTFAGLALLLLLFFLFLLEKIILLKINRSYFLSHF